MTDLSTEQMKNIMDLIRDLAIDAKINGRISKEEHEAIRAFCANGFAATAVLNKIQGALDEFSPEGKK